MDSGQGMENSVFMAPENISRLEKIAKKLENPEVLRLQIESLKSSMRMTKDGFDMLDRTISMTELLHSSEMKRVDIFLDVVKYLMPIFATSLITGMSINIINIKSSLLIYIGLIGLGALVVFMLILLSKRKKIINQQSKNYKKLNEIYSDWKKLSELQKKISVTGLDELNDDIRPIMEEVFRFQDRHKKDKNERDI